jgi:PAS domain S-box-containing protein
VNEASEVVMLTGNMERSLYQSLIFLNAIRESRDLQNEFTSLQELPPVKDLIPKFETELQKFEEAFSDLEVILGNDESLPEDINGLYTSYKLYNSLAGEWLNLSSNESDQVNLIFLNSIEPYFRNNIIPEITKLRNYVLTIQEERNETLNGALRKAVQVNFFATGLSILFAVILAIYIYRSFANPLTRLAETAKKLGEGHLDERIEVKSNDEIGELGEAINTMAAGLQDKTVSKEYLDNIIESIQEALFVADNNGMLLMANSAAAKMTGYKQSELINRPVKLLYDLDHYEEAYVNQKTQNKSFEFAINHKNGSTIPVLYSESELKNIQGEVVGSVSVASDISDRKKHEEEIKSSLKEKEVMLAEIHHRVKNNLALISGLLQLQSFSIENDDVIKALNDSQSRIQSIALVHEMLYESESLAYIQYDKYVKDLLQAINSMNMNEEQEILLKTDVDKISLTINQAIPCSLLLNELIVNAYKHAFIGMDTGEIFIKMKSESDGITLTVSDNGIGVIAEKFLESDTLGSQLIKTLSKQLNGELEIVNNPNNNGSKFKITFQLHPH